MSTLYIVATPIGNLEDLTSRALRVLRESDLILCEDTRKTQNLLAHYNIKTPTLSYHQHSKLQRINYILDLLRQDKIIALVSDSGTPGISDPGNKLISYIVTQLNRKNQLTPLEARLAKGGNQLINQVTIIPIPGPSAVIAALSICGFPADKFLFLGFPPHKKGRQKFFQEIAVAKYTVIFYESPYRILKTLNELNNSPDLKNREIMVGRELTKKFETIYRGTIQEVLDKLKREEVRGEFVVIINQNI